jgi:hypothetical protein
MACWLPGKALDKVSMRPNPSIERTSQRPLRCPLARRSCRTLGPISESHDPTIRSASCRCAYGCLTKCLSRCRLLSPSSGLLPLFEGAVRGVHLLACPGCSLQHSSFF